MREAEPRVEVGELNNNAVPQRLAVHLEDVLDTFLEEQSLQRLEM